MTLPIYPIRAFLLAAIGFRPVQERNCTSSSHHRKLQRPLKLINVVFRLLYISIGGPYASVATKEFWGKFYIRSKTPLQFTRHVAEITWFFQS